MMTDVRKLHIVEDKATAETVPNTDPLRRHVEFSFNPSAAPRPRPDPFAPSNYPADVARLIASYDPKDQAVDLWSQHLQVRDSNPGRGLALSLGQFDRWVDALIAFRQELRDLDNATAKSLGRPPVHVSAAEAMTGIPKDGRTDDEYKAHVEGLLGQKGRP